MSEFCKPFEESFVCRTNKMIQDYSGDPYDATVLLNCMLGMLVVPFEKYKDKLEEIDDFSEIREMFDQLKEKKKCKFECNYSVLEIIRHLRNATSHFHVTPRVRGGKVTGFLFQTYEMNKLCDLTGEKCQYKNEANEEEKPVFRAELTLQEMKKLARHIKDYVLSCDEKTECRSCDYRMI